MSPKRNKTMPDRTKEVLQHFLRRPRPTGSLQDIASWGLAEATIHRRTAEIANAVSWLVDLGLLEKRAIPGSAPLFLLNDDKATDAEKLLRRLRQRGKKERE